MRPQCPNKCYSWFGASGGSSGYCVGLQCCGWGVVVFAGVAIIAGCVVRDRSSVLDSGIIILLRDEAVSGAHPFS